MLLEKRRFLVEYGSDNSDLSEGGTDDVVITVKLLDYESQPASASNAGVRMEVGYNGDSSPAVVSTGTAQGTTPIGNTLAIAESVGDGYWRVALHPSGGWDFESRPDKRIGVAVLAVSYTHLTLPTTAIV